MPKPRTDRVRSRFPNRYVVVELTAFNAVPSMHILHYAITEKEARETARAVVDLDPVAVLSRTDDGDQIIAVYKPKK